MAGEGEALLQTGARAYDARDYDAAIENFELAFLLNPTSLVAIFNLAIAYLKKNRYRHALSLFELSRRMDPTNFLPRQTLFAKAYSSFLMDLQYRPEWTREVIFEAHTLYASIFSDRQPLAPVVRAKNKKIRIGYVSSDFYSHPVGIFTYRLFERHDRNRFELFCYSNGNIKDKLTHNLQSRVDHWLDISGMDDASVAQAMAADGLDILVDLAGHTGGNRLGVLFFKPAPVQISFLGYFDTTGVPAIDYLITGDVAYRVGDERFFTEKVLTVPGTHFCYALPDFAAEPGPIPSTGADTVTFGSFNNAKKMNDEVVALWSRILRHSPHFRLLLKWGAYTTDAALRQGVVEMFRRGGVDSAQLVFEGYDTYDVVFARYNSVDVALDPFPFTGALTTCDALAMGVPVVTLNGDRLVSRQTQGILTAMGLSMFVAENPDDYVRLAVELAGSVTLRANLRKSLRSALASSRVCDGHAFCNAIEAIFIRCVEQPGYAPVT